MLEPNTRELLLDVLRPPQDCELVHAVGTTYSLDLQALLFAPLSFAMFDWALDDAGAPNPIALLESLRRYADLTTVFCQAGEIGVPPADQPLLTYLEPSVVSVTAPSRDYIFHPKLWVLRFRPTDGGRDRYRVLCLTRNLTFDTSWDTACVLDGHRRRGQATIDHNRPLVEFLRALAGSAPTLDPHRRQEIDAIADDICDVRFDAPDGFDSVRFHPFGLADHGWPLPSNVRRTLVISPFLTAGTLDRLHGSEGGDVLISRPEMLDAIGSRAVDGYQTFAIADEAAQLNDAEADDSTSTSTPPLLDEQLGDAIDADLRGLHAKLIVAECAYDVRVYTGSANATDAAFGGNVEFMVELRTRQDGAGIDALLAQGSDATTLRDLLVEHRPVHDDPAETDDAQAVAGILDRARRDLGALRFTATLTPHDDDQYVVTLRGEGDVDLPEEVTTVRCWPISRGDNTYVEPQLVNHLSASFGAMSRDGITAFYAFDLHARRGDAHDDVRFVVNAELVGAPDDRRDRVITQILRSRQDVLRYLLFLLADTSSSQTTLAELIGGAGDGASNWGLGGDAPLLETLLRTLARDPDRLDHVAALLDDLRGSDYTDELVPPELDAVWTPIWDARNWIDA